MKLAMKLSVEQHKYWIEIIIIIYVDGNTRNEGCFKHKTFFCSRALQGSQRMVLTSLRSCLFIEVLNRRCLKLKPKYRYLDLHTKAPEIHFFLLAAHYLGAGMI